MDFMPMVHDHHFPRGAGGQQFRALLGFNEPDIHHQAAMNPWHAAAIWPEVERVASNYGVKTLVSPAMCGDIGKGTWWMGELLAMCCARNAVKSVEHPLKIHEESMKINVFCCFSGLSGLVSGF